MTSTSVIFWILITSSETLMLKTIESDCSSVFKFKNNLTYLLETRLSVNGFGTDFNVDWSTNNLFFTFITNSREIFLRILINSNGTLRFLTLQTPGTGQTSAVDNKNNVIYLGTNKGIFIYKYEGGQIMTYTADGADVMYITVNEDGTELYAAVFPDNAVLKITSKGLSVQQIPHIPNGHGLKVYKEYIYFYDTMDPAIGREKTPYIYRKSDERVRKINNFRNQSNVVFSISVKGEVFAMDSASRLYIIDSQLASATYLGDFGLSDITAFGFDSKGNIFMGRDQEILKFKYYGYDPCPYRNSSYYY